MLPVYTPFRLTILVASLFAWAGQASALGLGDMRSHSTLGGSLRAEIDVVTAGREIVDASCFRLVQPATDEGLPWLRQGSFTYRKGTPTVLELHSDKALVEPILQIGIVVGCGHQIRRDYTLFLSPRRDGAETPAPPAAAPIAGTVPEAPRRRALPRPAATATDMAPGQRPPRERRVPAPRRDRLVLSGGGDAGDTTLRLDSELASWKGLENAALDARRDLLRLEFRMLLAFNEQATSQLEAAEKLRNMEAILGELQQKAGEFAQRIENRTDGAAQAPLPSAPSAVSPTAVEPPKAPAASPAVVAVQPAQGGTSLLSEWSFYGLVFGAILGLAGWLGWRQIQLRRGRGADEPFVTPEPIVDPRRESERDEPGGVDLAVEPAAMGMPMQVDLHLGDAGPAPSEAPPPVAPVPAAGGHPDSQFSVSAATVDEHFEANPVMELAEIMLSFGRVKGAAQALQEFIDNSPQEALQPWIRLLDVYRMAGMRDEFERVAQNLNQHFNVEVLRWDLGQQPIATAAPLDLELVPREEEVAVPKASSLEGMPHICQTLIDSWDKHEVVEYLHRLLRDNRGGKRSGFTLEVVQEILFLIELWETKALIEREEAEQQGDEK